jgi:multiple sugar transport system permease protein
MASAKLTAIPASGDSPWRIFDRLANNEALLGLLFILPASIGFILFFAYPAIRSVFISFYEWNLLTDAEYVALANYQAIFEDERFWRALQTTLTYVLWNIPLQTTIALFIAVMMDRIHNSAWLRGLFVLPWLLPNVVVGLLWLWMLDPTLGITNVALEGLGISRQPFLGSPDQAIASIAGINIWRHAGYTAILIFAGLKTIPKGLYEAASIDGAGGWAQFWRITLPLLRPVLVFVLVTSIIGSFQVFDTIAITTGGGPAGSTRTIIYYIYEQVFERRIRMGTATAASVVLFGILISVTLIQMRYLRSTSSDLADYS